MSTPLPRNAPRICSLLITVSYWHAPPTPHHLFDCCPCVCCMSDEPFYREKVKQHRAEKSCHVKLATNWLTSCHVEPTQQCIVGHVSVQWNCLAFQVSTQYLITYDRTTPCGGIHTARSSRGMTEYWWLSELYKWSWVNPFPDGFACGRICVVKHFASHCFLYQDAVFMGLSSSTNCFLTNKDE